MLRKLQNFAIQGRLEKALRAYLVQNYDITGQKKELLNFFKSADTNHDGMINKEELLAICTETNIMFDTEAFLNTIDLNKD